MPNPVARRHKYRLYSPTSMTNAYMMVKEQKISVKKASKIFKVPDTTLRDRVLGKVDAETAVFGKSPVLDLFEEANLVNHFKTMASYGYGYTRQECTNIASDYAVHLGKRTREKPFTMKWMRGFLKRWPELRVLKPRGLEHARAKTTSLEVVTEYFKNLKETSMKHGLLDQPHLIFNVDEKGISVDHRPPHVVADAAICPQAVTSSRGKTVTILGGGSASGVSLPPFFVFPGKRLRQELLEGASPGTGASVSETGLSNGIIFREYLENHFLKFIPGRDGQKVLLLLDGHRSHISVNLVQWAREKGIIIFILLAHTSHVLQPMDVSCYGPLEKIYNIICNKHIRESAESINRYNICGMACKAYTKALSPENIQSGFRRTGVYPFNPDSVPGEYLEPAEVFIQNDDHYSQDSQATIEGGQMEAENNDEADITFVTGGCVADIHISKEQNSQENTERFFREKEKSLKEVKSGKGKKQRKTISKIVSGKELSKTVQALMESHESNQKYKKKSVLLEHKESLIKRKSKGAATKEPQPGPSTINLLPSDSDSEPESDIDPAELCCKCNKFQPAELRNCMSIVFTKWAQCDNCDHWVHLIYCTSVRVVRRGDSFLCHHCEPEQ